MIGRTLSHYRILSEISRGGMGIVYCALDLNLDRKVALKVLPSEMAENAERRARFEREAKAVAALDHPNIVTIYSVEEAEGVHFYTMQLVKGKTITELIPKKGLPLKKFFEIAIPLADAVSAAHDQGIVHRDLKPDNLMVGDDGRLKILDFGLAKLKLGHAEDGASELPTQSATAEGRILGTVAYMSPEQAEGKSIDHRSDIFSIGIILYEMATGERPFKGDTAASVLSSIIKDTPDPATEVNPTLPRDLGRIIRRCLGKFPGKRFQTAIDLKNELEELKQERDSREVVEGAIATPPSPEKKWTLAAAFVAVTIVAVIGTYLLIGPDREISDATPAPIEGTFARLTSQAGQELFPSLSPDGSFVVYASAVSGNWDIYLQRVGGENAMNLTENSTDDDTHPTFSPDGERIAFRSERDGGGLFLMGATGESVRRLTDFGFNPAWSPDGKKVVFATEGFKKEVRLTTSQIWTVDVENGETSLISERDGMQPNWSPSGNRIAYWSLEDASGNRTAQRNIWTASVTGGEAVPITDDTYVDWSPVWSSDGTYLYFASDRGGSMNIWRVRVDGESGNLLGAPAAVTTGGSGSRPQLALSRDMRRMAYVEEQEANNLWKVELEPQTATVAGAPIQITTGSKLSKTPGLSPNGQRVVFQLAPEEDLVVIRSDGTDYRRLTQDAHRNRVPRWSPDGQRIVFYSDRSGSYEIWTIKPDGSDLKQLTNTPGQSINYPSWSPDGSQIAFYNRSEGQSYIFDPNKPWAEQSPSPLPPYGEETDRFEVVSWSPDGWGLAGIGSSATEKPPEVVVYSFESNEYQRLATTSGGAPTQLWLPDGRSLLYPCHGKICSVNRVSGLVREVFSVPETSGAISPAFSLSRDGRWICYTHVEETADIWMLTLSEEQ